MKMLRELADAEDLILIGQWAIRIALGLLVLCIVALGAGLALQLFDIARGAT